MRNVRGLHRNDKTHVLIPLKYVVVVDTIGIKDTYSLAV